MIARGPDKKTAKKTDQKTGQKSDKKASWIRFFIFLSLIFMGFIMGGFFSFAQYVDKLSPPIRMPKADGIVVWTGKGGGRIEAGAKLLAQQKGERLLISGVNEKIDLETLEQLIPIDKDLAQCCVDLDYAAINTLGNARETAAWASALGYEHIILVTSAYHMPRARVEINAVEINAVKQSDNQSGSTDLPYQSGRMRITPYPVRRSGDHHWYSNRTRFKRITQEYGKLLVSYAKGRRHKSKTPILPTANKT